VWKLDGNFHGWLENILPVLYFFSHRCVAGPMRITIHVNSITFNSESTRKHGPATATDSGTPTVPEFEGGTPKTRKGHTLKEIKG